MNIAEALDYFLSRVAPELEALGLIRNKKEGMYGASQRIHINLAFKSISLLGFLIPPHFFFHSTFSINRSDLSNYVLNLENNLRKN